MDIEHWFGGSEYVRTYLRGAEEASRRVAERGPRPDFTKQTTLAWSMITVDSFDPRQALSVAAEVDHGIRIRRQSNHGTADPALETIFTDADGMRFLNRIEGSPEYHAAFIAGKGPVEHAGQLLESLLTGDFQNGDRGFLFGQFYDRHAQMLIEKINGNIRSSAALMLAKLNVVQDSAMNILQERVLMPDGRRHLQIFRNIANL